MGTEKRTLDSPADPTRGAPGTQKDYSMSFSLTVARGRFNMA